MSVLDPIRSLRAAAAAATVALALLLGPAGAGACVGDGDCDDGELCNGAEVCNAGVCEPGTPLGDGAQCNTGSGIACTLIDTCVGGVCTEGGGGDADGDGVCEAEDNCPGLANAGQEDGDGDALGDPCDAADAPVELVRAKLQLDKSQPGKTPRGKIVLKGDFIDPEGVAFQPGPGLTVRVQDAIDLDATFTWLPGECLTNAAGNHKCKSADKRYRAVLRPLRSSPRVVRFKLLFKQLDKTVVGGPFFAPVTVTIVTDPAALTSGFDRVGEISDCQQVGSGMKCKE